MLTTISGIELIWFRAHLIILLPSQKDTSNIYGPTTDRNYYLWIWRSLFIIASFVWSDSLLKCHLWNRIQYLPIFGSMLLHFEIEIHIYLFTLRLLLLVWMSSFSFRCLSSIVFFMFAVRKILIKAFSEERFDRCHQLITSDIILYKIKSIEYHQPETDNKYKQVEIDLNVLPLGLQILFRLFIACICLGGLFVHLSLNTRNFNLYILV